MDKGKELTVKIVQLNGSHYQFGLEQSKEIMSSPFYIQMNMLREMNSFSNSKKAEELLQTISPNLFEELKGLAAGLDMQLDEIIKIYSGYDVVFPDMGCSAFATDDYYVRNYDFSPELYDARLVFSNPTDGYASVGFSQQITGRLDGMNEKGLVVGLHFVNNRQKAEGFISTAILRMLLEQCENVEEAVNLITNVPHGYCFNYSLMDRSGRSVIVEASPQKQVVTFTNPLICTNHFESKELKEMNRVEIQGSVIRKEYIKGLVDKNL
jgi:predicted choloylglycine hydrolase